ncbi:transmembrane 9 superfamily member 4-like [Coregonus clupeaformis]|uniref:transmembrane 9 superfamily member 4-like n=1 Tax=Coregonus clupeaformis TaxID=59861 RepID=UPI001BE002BD|nr:transmembrane 9 superfamily member 4-like [Coregonus clupeaformis]
MFAAELKRCEFNDVLNYTIRDKLVCGLRSEAAQKSLLTESNLSLAKAIEVFIAIWENQFYYLFGFLFLVFIILVVSCSQISIVMVYFQLCAEDYRWWWRAFLVSGGSAFYVLVYAIFNFVNKLDIVKFIPSLLYFGYTALMVLSF